MRKGNDGNATFSFNDFLSTALAHWPWFALSVIVCCAAGLLYAKIRQPVYMRTAQVLIKSDESFKGASELGSLSGMDFLQPTSDLYDELAVIQAPDILAEVVRRLGLDQSYVLKNTIVSKTLYRDSIPVKVTLIDADPKTDVGFTMHVESDTVIKLDKFTINGKKADGKKVTLRPGTLVRTPVGKLTVTTTSVFTQYRLPLKIRYDRTEAFNTALEYERRIELSVPNNKANVIQIRIPDVVPQRGDDILNTIIEVYNERWVKDKNRIAVSTSEFIDDRLRVIESELGNVDADISSFKSSNLLPDLGASSELNMQIAAKANASILELSNRYHMAQYVKDYLEQSETHRVLPAASGFETPTIAKLVNDYNQKIIERDNLATISTASNPVVVDAETSLANLKKAISASLDSEMHSLKEQIHTQQRHENAAIEKISSNPKQAKYLLSVERQQKVKESLYLYLLQKREENELSQSFAAYNTRVIREPNGPREPSSLGAFAILFTAILIGLVAPYVMIVVKKRMTTTVHSADELKDLTLPMLAEIPVCSKKKAAEGIVVKKGCRDLVNEAFRLARTDLDLLLGRVSNRKVVMTTSYNQGAGKTFFTINLAMACALKGKRVVILDCDMRHGSVANYTGVITPGLSAYLAGLAEYDDIALSYRGNNDLIVIPAGKTPPNPTELLETRRFAELMERLRREYDYVLVDCAPHDVVADTRIIAPLCDLAVFVVRMRKFAKTKIAALQRLYDDKVFPALCIVVNASANRNRTNYYYISSDKS